MADIRSAMDAWLECRSGRSFWKAALDRLVRHRFFVDERELPIDLLSLAEELGFHVVFDEVLAGRLELDTFPRLIRIPKKASRRRQRFTIAHEIAHSLFVIEASGVFHSVFTDALRESPSDTREHSNRLEEYCDVAARAILLPSIASDSIEAARAIRELPRLIELACQFDVSPIIVFHRLNDLVRSVQFLGTALLKYCVNRHTGSDLQWRVVSPVILRAGGKTIRLWENKSVDKLGILLPNPESIVTSMDLKQSSVEIDGWRWMFTPQWDNRESDLILGVFESVNTSGSDKQLSLF
jgi:hypothetical protein